MCFQETDYNMRGRRLFQTDPKPTHLLGLKSFARHIPGSLRAIRTHDKVSLVGFKPNQPTIHLQKEPIKIAKRGAHGGKDSGYR
jgi:hypothetical protein